MGEPVVEVKTQDDSVSKKNKLESEEADLDAPDAKKVKLEGDSNGVEVKDVKEDNGGDDKAPTGDAELTAEERGVPDLEPEIACQVEYYFGNFNLPKDKFLQEQIKLDDGWVPLEVMLRFQRLASLSKIPATIVTSLKNCSTLMEVSDDGTKIRRSPNKPLPERNEEWQKGVNERTVYCKGFPLDQPGVGPYIQFFKQYGPVEHVNLRKYVDRQTKKLMFKGSADILFETKEAAEKFLALESVKYNDKELIRMTSIAHVEEKKKERDEKWGKKVKKSNPKQEEVTTKKDLTKGCVLKLTNINNGEVTREEIKTTLTEMGVDVGFVEFKKGDVEALVRLKSEEDGAATQFVKKLEESGEKIKLQEEEVTVSVVEGEEEETFLDKGRQYMERLHHKSHHRSKKTFHRGGGRGYRGANKRGRSPARDGPPAKKD